jgi:UDP:flavonoid glycosyltransferase YjiC (YdhE family)
MITGIPVVTHCCSGHSFSQLPEDLYGFCIKGDETPRQLAIMRKLNQEFFGKTDEWFNEHIAVPFNLGSIENAIGICSPEYAVAQTIRELSKERIAGLSNVRLTGPVIGESPSDVDFSRYQPYCYVSLGTSPWSMSEVVDGYRALAAHIPRKFTLVIGLGGLLDRHDLGITDERVVAFERAPQIAAIEHSEFVVCHGGCQTVHEALYFGKPIIGIPYQAETSEMVNSVEINSAGVRVMPGRVNDHALASAIETITSSETMAGAQRLAELLRRADGCKNMTRLFDSIEMRLKAGR